jgi:hypothetical protein
MKGFGRRVVWRIRHLHDVVVATGREAGRGAERGIGESLSQELAKVLPALVVIGENLPEARHRLPGALQVHAHLARHISSPPRR